MRWFVLAFGLSLSACALVDRETLGALNDLDPFTVQPSDLAVEIVWPDGSAYGLAAGQLTFSATRDNGQALEEVFDLAREGEVFSLAAVDHLRFRQTQERIAAWKAADPKGTKGSISVMAQPCLKKAPTGDLGALSINIRFAQDAAFAPLVRDLPVAQAVRASGIETLEPCPAA